MELLFTPTGAVNLLREFAAVAGVTPVSNTLKLPPTLRQGDLQAHVLQPGFELITHHYTLCAPLTLRRVPAVPRTDLMCIIFCLNELPIDQQFGGDNASHSGRPAAGITLSTDDMGGVFVFPVGIEIFVGILTLRLAVLRELLGAGTEHPLLTEMQAGSKSFFVYEDARPDIQTVVRQLRQPPAAPTLQALYYQFKAQELLYLFLGQLAVRPNQALAAMHPADAKRLMQVRAQLLADLACAPSVAALATAAGLSETRLKRLFRQVFGRSIYDYYQQARLAEARRLLRNPALSVADVGERLGFTNLSHFARLFRRTTGTTPKKYARELPVGWD
ncbi:transcriptional regulator, AraC family [Hymenobacter roseosalivarius DSM 11622]|uniref:Transcriptional regulator, AraC family n=1 Tax=Hymenobacter roseosalivarius DSM 11622 TaxID=645990 RepID=A0A1W1W173_9BACT|nr:AraC family transcriptional regulator [Hymenobacter roseosalivarius]SMB99348.1 transcriptional regulator, AraC family [Hymenobacter roseosalivarius DSM 11622]